MVHVILKNANYAYPVLDGSRSIKLEAFKSLVGGGLFKQGRRTYVHAIKNINIDLKAGDRLGLLGHNGAGKTTLLRLLGGLLPTSGGLIHTEGRIISLIMKGMGVQPELTGRENIELPLRILGASDEEVERGKIEIPKLIELGSFLDLPVRTYSEGMYARLSFGICTFLKGDILLLDEWIATGDAVFFAKANKHLKSYLDDTGILVLASHSPDLIRNTCNRVAIFDSGEIVAEGGVEEMIEVYLKRAAFHK